MDFSRTLLLKGLGGLAAVGTVGGGVVLGRNMLLKNQEGKDKVREEVNVKLKTLGLGEDCRLGKEDDPYTINKECDLNEEKLKAIKFSNKGTGDLVVKSSSGAFPEGLKLKFERKNKEEDISFSFSGLAEGSDIKVFGDESKGKIILKSSTPEQKFRGEGGMLEKDSSGVEDSLKSKLKEFNEKLGTVKAPIECRFDEAEKEESIECPITQEGLKGLKFSGVGEGDLNVKGQVPSGLKLKVDRDQEDISLSFTGLSQNLTIYGDSTKGKIIVKNSGENIKKFKVKDGKLTKGDSDETLKRFNDQLVKVNAPVECRFDETESETSVECSISQDQLKGLKFSNKEGDGELKIVGSVQEGLKLKAEKNDQNEMSLSFTGLSENLTVYGDKTKGKIVIKNASPETKFKVEDGKLTKDSTGVEETLKAKLKEFNARLGKVNAPIECRFDETETEDSVECGVSKEQLKTMVFTENQGDLTLSEEDFSGMKLKVQFRDEIADSKTSKEDKVLTLTFKDYDKTVKLTYEKEEDKNVSLVEGTNPEFGIYDKKVEEVTHVVLNKRWDPVDFEELLGLACVIPESVTKGECKFDAEEKEKVGEKKIKVKKETKGEFEELTITDTTNSKFELHKDVKDFNQGYKFVFSGSRVPEQGDSGAVLENNGEYEFKWKIQEKAKVGYLVKKGN